MHEIVVAGADNMERRQASYCGLYVFGSLSDILTMSGIYHPGLHAHILQQTRDQLISLKKPTKRH
jgi:hypothetical protein